MSRFAFIAAATLFTGLLIVLTMAIAHRDARGSRTIADVSGDAYEDLRAEPILVASKAIGPDGGIASKPDIAAADPALADQPWVKNSDWPQPPIVRGNDSTIPQSRELPPLPTAAPAQDLESIPNVASLPPLPFVADQENRSGLDNSSEAIGNGDATEGLVSPDELATDELATDEPATDEAMVVLASGQNPVPAPPPSLPTNSPPEPARLNPARIPDAALSALPANPPPAASRSAGPPSVIGSNPNGPVSGNSLPSATLLNPQSLGQTPPSAIGLPELPSLSPPAGGLPSTPSLPSVPSNPSPSGLPTPSGIASPSGFPAPSALPNAPGTRSTLDGPASLGVPSAGLPPIGMPSGGLPSNLPSDPPSIAGALSPGNGPSSNSGLGASNGLSGAAMMNQNRAGAAWSMVTPIPGARQFDGSQNPSLEIHKRAPSEVQVGIPATFTAVVRNVGNSTAFEVQVTDAIPKGARLVRSMPEAQRVGNDGLVWNLGELAAGQEVAISMEIVPETEGELGSVASVKFAAQASVRTISTQPKLSIKQTAAPEVLGGDTTTIMIDITNTGSGTAKDVRLEEDVPGIFRHLTGASALQQDVGDLAPGETLRFEIELTALAAGKANNVVRATSANSATAESSTPIEIRAPKLQMQLVGPKLRHLERPAPYEAVIENVGTALARDLYITARLPRGMNFISATNEGTYLPDQHAVVWNLLELAAGNKAKTEVTLLPVEEGKFTLLMTTEAEGLRADPVEREVLVEGQSELVFDIDDDNDPIETSGVTTYSVKINNIGTRPDQEVRLVIEIPDGAVVEQVYAPMKYQASGRQIVFASIPSLASKEQVVVKVAVKHGREGTQILRAALQSQLRPVPVIRDESTQVYTDR